LGPSGSSSIQGLLQAIARYDREIEPLEFRIDSYRLELKPFLDSLVSDGPGNTRTIPSLSK